jgi:hypothetical protein
MEEHAMGDIAIKGVDDDFDVLSTDDLDPDRVGDLSELTGSSAVAARKAGGQLIALGHIPTQGVARRQANRGARHDQCAYYRPLAPNEDDAPLRSDQPDLLGARDGVAARAHAELAIHRPHL